MILETYRKNCTDELHSGKYPSLRTYKLFKPYFICEPYLLFITEFKYRHAIAKMRLSSHQLEIERSRHTKPTLYVNIRICINCQQKAIEDEIHVTTACDKYNEIRKELISL